MGVQMDFFNLLDYLGTFVFAITGASVGGKSKFDLFGMLFLALLTSCGGGTVRDIIIMDEVFWTVNSTYLYIVLIATVSTFFFRQFYERHPSILLFLDSLGLGFFTVVGTQKALLLGQNIETAIIMGTITAVLGGILRSAFSGEFSILRQKELYATVAAASSVIFIIFEKLGFDLTLCASTSVGFTLAIRYGVIKYGIKLPVLEKE